MNEQDLYNRLYHANRAMEVLIDEDAEDAADYRQTCDECAILIRPAFYDDHDGLCTACWNAVHFTCSECGEEFHVDDMFGGTELRKRMCEECGVSAHQDEVDEIASEISDLLGNWDGDCDEIAKLKKVRAYIKKLSK